jgi:cellulose synthase/poly-beta-1,6-N-acetylglucosamine synthase-like glycosyltransferase
MNTAISIVIPTWNEEKNIKPLVERIHLTLRKSRIDYEIIFVDDHSSDNTYEVIRNLKRVYPISLHLKRGERGKAQSLLEGFAKAKHNLICMIDADLQYPPEAIPAMIKKLGTGYDIVVADRTKLKVSFVRRFISRVFLHVFGKLLHKLDVDVQSGLKVFRRSILKDITIKPTPWTFDLDFLVKARMNGYKITSVPITFSSRHSGKAKINLLRASWEVGLRALFLKLNPPLMRQTIAAATDSLVSFNGKSFRPYSALNTNETAMENITKKQKQIIVGSIIALLSGLVINWQITLILLVSALTILYFLDLLFNYFLIYRSFTKNPEISFTDKELTDIPEALWPKYTVFCPLYKEWEVLPQFIRAMSALDYPKEKLQVMLLLEEDDAETIKQVQKMTLPAYFATVIVPDSQPKTKPKALNYGLLHATGDYVVVYDAEDIPDPKQLKKAVLAFQKARKETICVQAKLNFYNPQQNILTRLFTAEYSLWFDLVLTGLQSIKAPIPLGGTSNHFKIQDLKRLQGWDAFNVTEDCDLGTRLTKNGYYTAMFDSTTFEEANSDIKNWYYQRSRWIKGYIQTYLVHMRNPRSFFTDTNEPHFLTFQFIVGGKILSLFINPFMWAVTASYFLMRPIVGETIESLYPMPIFYLGVFSMIVGNFLYVYYYMIGCAKRQQEELIPFIFFVPFYWLGMSIASWRALYEVVRKPHYWSKTKHGLHLSENTGVRSFLRDRLRPIPLPISPAFLK